jgi:myo-inositol-1(or 4)-monophosphatase
MSIEIKDVLVDCATQAGAVLRKRFGRTEISQRKESQSSVVTEADLLSEQCIVEIIQSAFPDHNILSEEAGFAFKGSDMTWVVDPLDGTSNFAAGVPWFGVLIAVLKDALPVAAVAHIPMEYAMYLAEAGHGVTRNGKPVEMTIETDLSNLLCAYGMDGSDDPAKARRETSLMRQLVGHVRNVRATNSLIDFCYTIDGRFGACLNRNTKIWDIAPSALMFAELGGILSDFRGEQLRFDLTPDGFNRSYEVIGTTRNLLPQILEIVAQSDSISPLD